MVRLICVLSVLGLVSCVAGKPSSQSEISAGQGIMGGSPVKAGTTIASSVVAIFDTKEKAICTGSLLADGLVLTAAHCVQTKASNLKIVFGLDVDETMNAREPDVLEENVRRVLAVLPHEDYDNKNSYLKKTDWSDIALIKFAGAIPEGYKPVEILEDDSILERGLQVTLAGYGVSKVDMTPVKAKDIPNLDEAMEYGEVICDDGEKNCLQVDMSGDGLLRVTEAPVASVHETEVVLNESKGHGTCAGDSGGPAFVMKDGKFYQFGVTSRGSVSCSGTGVYTNVVYFKKWVTEAMQKLK